MSMLLILLLSVASAFLDPLEGDVRAAYSALAGGLSGLKIDGCTTYCRCMTIYDHHLTVT